MKSKTTIEFNNRVFDVHGGHYLKPRNNPQKKPLSPAHSAHKASTHSIDGVIKNGAIHSQPAKQPKAPPKPVHHRQHSRAPHAHKHSPQKARTLARAGLKRPLILDADWKDQAAQLSSQGVGVLETMQTKAFRSRLSRASKIHKSQLVSRFTPQSQRSPLVKKMAHLPVVKPLAHHRQPLPKIVSTAVPINQIPQQNAFESVIASATSHEAKPLRAPKLATRLAKKLKLDKKAAKISAGALAVLLIVGFLTYQNIPNLKLRLAAAKASINASLPNYQPAGFTLGAINDRPGQVTINFSSNTDNRSFLLTQAKSGWNSEALLNNYVASGNKPYQTYQELGKTIFIYDESNATWVDGGVWYKIEGDAQLTSDQLLRIARSL